MADNGYLTGVTGCGVRVSGAVISSGGCTLTTPSPIGLDTDILLTGGGLVTINTTFPTDLSAAYQEYIEQKQRAIYSGGSCVYVGTSQNLQGSAALSTEDFPFMSGAVLSGGYAQLGSSCMTTLNGVQGSLETGDSEHTYKSNINFLPTVGFWEETDKINDLTVTVLRILQDCIKCQDYNDLYVMEMILYHAINKVTWRLLREAGTYVPGTWQQYQGALYRWNANTYTAQYVYALDKAEDTFTLKIGWINTTCTNGVGFAAWGAITGPGVAPYLRYQLMYGGSPATNNAGTIVAFIANPIVTAEGAQAPGLIYYISGSKPSTDTLDAAGLLPGNQLSPVFEYAEATSIQDFNTADNTGVWYVGILCVDMAGDGYGACAFQLGYAQKITDNVEVSKNVQWTYTIAPHWTTKVDGTAGSYDRAMETIIVNGLVAQ